MGAGGHEINTAIKNCTGDDGFWRDLGLSLADVRNAAGNSCVVGASDPVPVLTSDVIALTAVAAASSTWYLMVQLPEELADQTPGTDANSPFQALRVGACMFMAGTPTNTPLITVTAKVVGRSGAVKATYTATYLPPLDGSAPTTASVGNITTPLEYAWEFTEKLSSVGSFKMTRGDLVIVKFAAATHTTDLLTISNVWARAKVNAARYEIQGSGNTDR